MKKNPLPFFLLFCLLATPAKATVSIAIQSAFGAEERAAHHHLPVLAYGEATGPFSVTFTVTDSTATADVDYEIVTNPKQITWTQAELQQGYSVKFIEIRSVDDGTEENQEVFQINLGSTSGDATVISAAGAVAIYDSTEYPGGVFSMKRMATSGVQGSTVTLTVERMDGTTGAVTATVSDDDTVDPSVTQGTDYLLQSGSNVLNFADGETEKTIDYSLVPTGTQTPATRFFQVAVSNVQSASSVGYIGAPIFVFILYPSQVTNDPHVILHVNGIRLPICFDLKGEEAQTVLLVNTLGLAASGTFQGDNYFKAINVTIAGTEYYFTANEYEVGRKKKNWKKDDNEYMENVEVIDDGKVRVTGPDSVVVIEQVEGEEAESFVNFYVESIDMRPAGGIIGSILTTVYAMNENNGIGTLTSVNGIATATRQTKFGQECWFVDEGKNIYRNDRSYYNM